MKILTIDTSDRSIVGFVECGADVVELARSVAPDARHHAETLTPMVAEVLGGERPDAIVVGTGPAAFTGLRAGLMTARALARGWSVPVYGLSSLEVIARVGLDALAAGAQKEVGEPDEPAGEATVTAVIDARRKELFVARVRAVGADDVEIVSGPEIVKPADLGEGVFATVNPALYPELEGASEAMCEPTAMARLLSARLARIEAGEDLGLDTEPQYLRRPDIHQK